MIALANASVVPFLSQAGSWLIAMSLHLAVLTVLLALFDRLLRRWLWPGHRLWIGVLVPIKMLLPLDAASPVSVTRLADRIGEVSRFGGGGVPIDAGMTAFSGTAGWPSAGVPVLVALLWIGGTVACVVLAVSAKRRHEHRLLDGRREVSGGLVREVRRAAARVGISTLPVLVVSAGVRSPMVAGRWRLRRPAVLFLPPDAARHSGTEMWRHALLHELMHLRRRDPRLGQVCLIAQALFWFHPGLWWWGRHMSALREEACDRDVAALLGGAAVDYRDSLLSFAARRFDSPATGGLGLLGRRCTLLRRLHALDSYSTRGGPARVALGALGTFVLVACAVPLGSAPRLPSFDAADRAAVALELSQPGCLALRYRVLGLLARAQHEEPARPAVSVTPSTR